MRLLLVFMVLLGASHAFAGEYDAPFYKGELTLHLKDLPKFENYPAEPTPAKIAAEIDWSSHKSAKKYKTRLRNGLKEGPNFNGHYNVVTYGCGTGCQGHLILDVANGKVIKDFTTSYGIAYRKDSALIITELPLSAEPNLDDYYWLAAINFYEVKNGKLAKIRTIRLKDE